MSGKVTNTVTPGIVLIALLIAAYYGIKVLENRSEEGSDDDDIPEEWKPDNLMDILECQINGTCPEPGDGSGSGSGSNDGSGGGSGSGSGSSDGSGGGSGSGSGSGDGSDSGSGDGSGGGSTGDKICAFPIDQPGVEGCPSGMTQDLLTEGREHCCVFENKGCDETEWWELGGSTPIMVGDYQVGCEKTDATLEGLALVTEIILFEFMQNRLAKALRQSSAKSKLSTKTRKPTGTKPNVSSPKTLKAGKVPPKKPGVSFTQKKANLKGPTKPGVSFTKKTPNVKGQVRPKPSLSKFGPPKSIYPKNWLTVRRSNYYNTIRPGKKNPTRQRVKPTYSNANRNIRRNAPLPRINLANVRTPASRAASRASLVAARRTFTGGVYVAKYAAKTGKSAGIKVAGAAARAGVKIGTKAAARAPAAAATGPAGWAAFALMIMFEIVIAVLDIVGLENYDTYTSQESLHRVRRIVDHRAWKENKESSIPKGYPCLMPLSGLGSYTEEYWQTAYMTMFTELSDNYIQPLFEISDDELDSRKVIANISPDTNNQDWVVATVIDDTTDSTLRVKYRDGSNVESTQTITYDRIIEPGEDVATAYDTYMNDFSEYIQKATKIEEEEATKWFASKGLNEFGELWYVEGSDVTYPWEGETYTEFEITDWSGPTRLQNPIPPEGSSEPTRGDMLSIPASGQPLGSWNLFLIGSTGHLDPLIEEDENGEYMYDEDGNAIPVLDEDGNIATVFLGPMIFNTTKDADSEEPIEYTIPARSSEETADAGVDGKFFANAVTLQGEEVVFMLDYIKRRFRDNPNIVIPDGEGKWKFPWTETTNLRILNELDKPAAREAGLDESEAVSGPDMPDSIIEWQMSLIDKMHIKRDELLYNALQDEMKNRPVKNTINGVKNVEAPLSSENHILEDGTMIFPPNAESRRKGLVLVPFLSEPGRIGITITEDAAKEWNATYKQFWLETNDIYKPPERTMRNQLADPMVAVYTDSYLVPNEDDPGTMDNPNMRTENIKDFNGEKKKVVISGAYGPLMSYCLRKRSNDIGKEGMAEPVDPVKEGVTFDVDTLTCNFTSSYCDRYGLKFKSTENGNDCETYPGQDFFECIFGKTLTRGVIRTYKDKVYDNIASGDPLKVALGTLHVINPYSLAIHAIGEIVVKEIGETIHKDRSDIKKRSCKWYNSRYSDNGTAGTDCWLNTIHKKSSLKEQEPCSKWSDTYGDHLYDDGTSCWRHAIPKKSRMAYKVKCDGKVYHDGELDPGPSTPLMYDKGWKDAYGKLHDDGTSCWKHIYAKSTSIATKRSCEGDIVRSYETGELLKYPKTENQIYKWTDDNDGNKLSDDGTSCWHMPPKWRGVGTMPKCPPGDEKDAGLCYTSCGDDKFKPSSNKINKRKDDQTNYQGVGPVCWQKGCWEDDGTKSVGVKRLQRGLLCYEDCRDRATKPTSLGGEGNTHNVPEHGKTWYNISLLECGSCPPNKKPNWGLKLFCEKSGDHDVFERTAHVFQGQTPTMNRRTREQAWKHSFTRGVGKIPDDCGDKERKLGLCYTKCSEYEKKNEMTGADGPSYEGVGPFCVRKGDIAKIERSVFDRYKCGPSKYQPDICVAIDTLFDTTWIADKLVAQDKVVKALKSRKTSRSGEDFSSKRSKDGNTYARCGPKSEFDAHPSGCNVAPQVITDVENFIRNGPPSGVESGEFKKRIQFLLDCPKLRKNVGGVCWDRCRPGDEDQGAICAPKIGVGIKKSWIDQTRQLCGQYTNAPQYCKAVGGTGTNTDENVRKQVKEVVESKLGRTWPRNGDGSFPKYDKNHWILKDDEGQPIPLFDHVDKYGITPRNRWILEKELGCLRKNVGGVCWDRCPSKYEEDGGWGVEFDDLGGGPVCWPVKDQRDGENGKSRGAGIRVTDFQRRKRCGISSYQPSKCIAVDEKDVDRTLQNLKPLTTNNAKALSIYNDLKDKGFTDENTGEINELLECPKRRKYVAGLCWDQCPRANLNPNNKEQLKLAKDAKELAKTFADERQIEYDQWKGIWDLGNYIDIDAFGWDDQVNPSLGEGYNGMIPSIYRGADGKAGPLLKTYMEDMTAQERTDKLNELQSALESARNTYYDLEGTFDQEVAKFRRDFSLGYKDIGLLCEPRNIQGLTGKEREDADEAAKLINLTPAEKGTRSLGSSSARRVIPWKDRVYCDPPKVRLPNDLVSCWSRCPAGYRDDGWTCNKI